MREGPLVLVVDDDAAIRETARMILEEEGYATEVACDGTEVLEQLGAGVTPSLILLDLMMPRMDGRAVLRALEARAEMAKVPVVLMTASSATAETSSLEYPMLRKPFGLDHFMQVVTTYCPRLWDDDEPPTEQGFVILEGGSSATSRDRCVRCASPAGTRCMGCGEAFCRACFDDQASALCPWCRARRL
ncbi:MAG TPA: response regulator [Polyangiaceae bacterium]|jgi:CheY-like chemotaxis protein